MLGNFIGTDTSGAKPGQHRRRRADRRRRDQQHDRRDRHWRRQHHRPQRHYGIDISGSGTTGNVVLGNFIGTDASGDTGWAIPAPVSDIRRRHGNTIGGTATGAATSIAFNAGNAVVVNTKRAMPCC